MTDYRKLEEQQQVNIERALTVEGLHGEYFDRVSQGDLCAICLRPSHTCLCSHDDEE